MLDLETQIRAYADEVEQLVPVIRIPAVPLTAPNGRRWRAIAAAAVVAASVVVAVVAQNDDAGRSGVTAVGDKVDQAGQTVPADSPDGCVPSESSTSPPGLGGAPVAEVLPGGVGESFDIGPLFVRAVRGPELDGDWYAVSAAVSDAGGRPLGTPVWVMPDAIVAIAGGVRHLYAADQLAEDVSDWGPAPVSIPSEELAGARACVSERHGLTFISGDLGDGTSWVVVRDPERGLCVVLRSQDLGCDDSGPVLPAGAPMATPRIVVDDVPVELPEDQAGELVYAELPDGATTVTLTFPNGTSKRASTINVEARLWAAPVQPGNLPQTVSYTDQNGDPLDTFTVYG